MKPPRISVVCNTARAGHSMPGREHIHIFDLLCRCLRRQRGDFLDFELVVADTEYDTRPDWFVEHPQPFPAKHVPVRNWWLDHGLTAISACKNESVIHAEGDRIITVDDSTMLPSWFLATAMRMFDLGGYPVSWYRHLDDQDYTDPRLALIPGDRDFVITDMDEAKWQARDYPLHGWGYVGFTADAFYAINGYEEWYDGGRGQEDVEFSLRMMRAGHRLGMHRRLWVGIMRQGPVEVYRNPDIPEGVVHCTSALSPLLYSEIVDGLRRQANAEPYPGRILDEMFPTCRWYVPDDRHDVRVFVCPECGHETRVKPAAVEGITTWGCPECLATMAIDEAQSVDLVERCSLYRDPCPFVPKGADGRALTAHTALHMHHNLAHRGLIERPDRWVRDLRGEHAALVGMPVGEIDGTYVGTDWRG